MQEEIISFVFTLKWSVCFLVIFSGIVVEGL